jgi:hypothetical protein
LIPARKKKEKKKGNTYTFPSIHATALATFAESVGELGLLSSLKDKEEITLLSLELEVNLFLHVYKPLLVTPISSV